MPFIIVPASQVAQKPKKPSQSKVGRSQSSSPNQKAAQKKNVASGSSRAVTVAAYGGKLFEPIITREKPIYVHFKEFLIRDDNAITRFSEDGWFAIKFFLEKDNEHRNRCYLVYFLNPINATEKHNLFLACQEAIEYKVYEFWDKQEYVEAVQRQIREGRLADVSIYAVDRLRSLSALGQVEQKIIEVLREKITAEKFLLRQKEYAKQDKEWEKELERQHRIELAELEAKEKEAEDELENNRDEGNESIEISEVEGEEIKNRESIETSKQEGQEVSGNGIQEQKIESREAIKVEPSKPKPFILFGGKK
jgi:hypothetical protein